MLQPEEAAVLLLGLLAEQHALQGGLASGAALVATLAAVAPLGLGARAELLLAGLGDGRAVVAVATALELVRGAPVVSLLTHYIGILSKR